MKRAVKYLLVVVVAAYALFSLGMRIDIVTLAQEVKKMPETIILGKDAKLGQITFNHVSHNGGKYSVSGTGPIACTECHHTAQPAAELEKRPPLKTSWPAGRTTTLTADLFAKDPNGAGVAACHECHARAGMTPKNLPAIPKIKLESGTGDVELTNQQAFHRACTSCHAEVKKNNPASKGPTAMQCTACHKKA